MDKRIPVTIISGFLGAGKTTLINQLLQSDQACNITVLVNDFGAVNIDTDLIIKREREVMELSNGCVCCSIQSDMVAQLHTMFTSDNPPEYLLIETSGVAQPGRIASVFGYPQLSRFARLDSVVTLIDVANIDGLSDEAHHLVRSQIEAADLIIATKADLVDPEARRAIYDRWLFADLPALEATHGAVPVSVLLDQRRGNLEQISAPETALPNQFVSAHWSSDKSVSYKRLQASLKRMSGALYRAKGIVYCDEFPTERIVFNKVGARIDFAKSGAWDGVPRTAIVGIGYANAITAEQIRHELEVAQGPG
ncbi:CobW family GTP-binding protein [Ruegeria meonggei]|uniref:Putative metal chaperone YciC n=1 Tax=Ruegeria meonggei TaxID=1446476 RepID=A0A1X7A1J6_9RHOB|nr:GTP-binding protein [Ruegeria meonggei]SLN67416.1 Putative metal chaperone YciC [Ruegeria meonggei]